MAVDKSLISGSTALLIMKLVEERDMYGYEMIHTLRERSKDVFELKVGTLYPLLHSLVKAEYMTCYEKEVNDKVRKYYHLTPQGKKALQSKTKEWREYANAMYAVIGGMTYETV